jgi:signal transduction histidine kinase
MVSDFVVGQIYDKVVATESHELRTPLNANGGASASGPSHSRHLMRRSEMSEVWGKPEVLGTRSKRRE